MFILIWSCNAKESDFVDLEWTIAVALKRTVCIIDLDGSELPPTLRPYQNIRTADPQRAAEWLVKKPPAGVALPIAANHVVLQKLSETLAVSTPKQIASSLSLAFLTQSVATAEGPVFQFAGPGTVYYTSEPKKTRSKIGVSVRAIRALTKIDDPNVFEMLFNTTFTHIDQDNSQAVYDLNRILTSKFKVLQNRAWNPKTKSAELEGFNPPDRDRYRVLEKELGFLSQRVASNLKAASGHLDGLLDLHAMTVWNADLRATDFTGANLTRADFSESDLRNATLAGAQLDWANLYSVQLEGANLAEINAYEGVSFLATAWWLASQISPALLEYLRGSYPLDCSVSYPEGRSFLESDYQADVLRLRASRL